MPIEQKRAIADSLDVVGGWEPWQIILISAAIILPILITIGFVAYMKYWKPKKDKNGNSKKPPQDLSRICVSDVRFSSIETNVASIKTGNESIREEIKQVITSLREVRVNQSDMMKEITESKENDADHKARINALEREVFKGG